MVAMVPKGATPRQRRDPYAPDMTSGPRVRVIRTALTRGLILSSLVLALAGCEQPRPGATAWSGTTSEYRPALCWADQGVVDTQSCAEAESDLPEIPVLAGRVIGISIDPKVAKNGWIPFLDNEPMTQGPITSSYWRVPFPGSLRAQGATLRVISLGESGSAQGLWAWRLIPQN
jgi:hypothetical protein